MKHDKYKWLGSALCLALMLVTASCSMSDDMECPPDNGGQAGAGTTYIQLSFGLGGVQGTRSNPSGGENGDGSEAGQETDGTDENSVSSAVAFLFDGDLKVGGAASTPVTAVRFSQLTRQTGTAGYDAVYTTEAQPADLDYGDYNIIVVANPGDEEWWSSITNLGGVRDKILQKAWDENNGQYSNFLMASASEPAEPLHLTSDCTSENPAQVTVNVERMAARVDYNALASYDCGDPQYNGATIEITGATIVNRFNAGSFLLKRVSDNATVDLVIGEGVEYLGDETTDGNNVAINYVLDPWTKDKTAANADLQQFPFTVNGQKVNAEGLYVPGTYYPSRSDDPEDWAGYCQPGTDMEERGDGLRWKRVGYTLENTTSSAETARRYNTGIVFKAEFIPDGLVGYDKEKKPTFFSYDGTLYATLTGMMGALNSPQDFAQYVEGRIAGCRSWADVTAFADELNDPTGYAEYLRTNQNGDFTVDAVTTWTEYLNTELGVVEDSDNGPKINQGEKNTRQLLYASSGERLRTYFNSQCYYIWWLRHSNNNDDTTNGVMEYAIVRNNIYKVNVTGVYSLGGDIPGDEELRANVYVKDWEGLDPETLPM